MTETALHKSVDNQPDEEVEQEETKTEARDDDASQQLLDSSHR
jgi:hypothetical protein